MVDSERRAGLDSSSRGRTSFLLLAHPTDGGATAYCRDHLVPGDAHEVAQLLVRSTDRIEQPSNYDLVGRSSVVVAVDDSTRSTNTSANVPASPSSPTETVVATGDIGSLGPTVDDYVTTWSASGCRPIVCVDSLSGLVERASVGDVYRFLYVLLHRVDRTGGHVHVHVDPRHYEEEIMRTFFSLFDRVVSFHDGGAFL